MWEGQRDYSDASAPRICESFIGVSSHRDQRCQRENEVSEDGWHDDRYCRTTKRYFDGAQGTEHVVSAGVQTTNPLPGQAQVLPAVDNPSQHANLGLSPAKPPRPLAALLSATKQCLSSGRFLAKSSRTPTFVSSSVHLPSSRANHFTAHQGVAPARKYGLAS